MTTCLIVGAGATGIGAAVRLSELGVDYEVVEAGDAVGGMSASITDPAGFTWDLGGHVIHSHFPEFDQAVADSGVTMNAVTRNGWVWLRGTGPETLVATPIQQQLAELPTDLRPDAPIANLADYYRNHFGSRLYDVFFEPYNYKMWTTPLAEIDDSWTSLRGGSDARNVPRLALAGTIGATESTFPYPVGGTGALWQAVAEKLTAFDRFRFRTRVVELDTGKRVAHLDDGSTVGYDHCVTSIPMTVTLEWAGLGRPAHRLRASTLYAVGLGVRGTPPEPLADKTWLYCPDRTVPWYRATMLSNYDAGNAGPGRWNVLCEVPLLDGSPARGEDALAGVVDSLTRLGLDPARIEATFVRRIEMGYPVPTLGRDDVLREVDAALTHRGIYSRGRFGGWRYESSNQDYCYLQGRQAVEAALHGHPEDVYWHPERF